MKKFSSKKIIILLAAVAIPVFALATPHFAFADCGLIGVGSSVTDCIFVGTSWIAELAFQIAGAFLTIAGVLLNGTMVATLNIKQIVDATTAIGTVWRTIRDFSSIFIIFLLLYASIKMILGMKDSGLGNLIKNIIIAGLLINFSLFITKFAVDSSNIVSLTFYNAIAPGQGTVAPSNSVQGLISNAFNDGGISNVFMQSLDIQRITGTSAFTKNPGTDPNSNRTITMAYAGGTVLMVTTAFSFIFAAVAFAIRIGILILLMAFSPIYFIGMILPKTKEYADMWLNTLIAMCLFMPVYLFLMYVAMSIINDPQFFNFAKVTSISSTSGTNNSIISAATVGIVLQYLIAFLFINAPMAAAIKIGSDGTDIAVKWGQAAKKWTQDKLKTAGGSALQGTAGNAARRLNDSEAMRKFSSYAPTLGLLTSQGLSKTSSSTFGGAKGGYDAKLKANEKAKEEFNKKIGTVDRSKYSSQEAYDRAKKEADNYQERYRTNLAGIGNNPLWNFVSRDRSSLRTGYKLIDEAEKEEAKKNLSKNQAELKETEDKITRIKETLGGVKGKDIDEDTLDLLRMENKELDEALVKKEKLVKLVKKGSKASEEEVLEKLKKQVNKDEDGGGEKKEEKKKEDKK